MTGIAPKDELVPPEWMNKTFFQKVLAEIENETGLEVTKFMILPGSSEGDHYASVMFRGILNYNTSKGKNLEKIVVIKTMPFVDGPKKDFLINSGIFDMEVRMYKDVIPLFENILEKAGDATKFGCKCLYSSLEPHKILILEDLTQKNYHVPKDCLSNVDLFKKALIKLAKWHAISFKEHNEGNKIFQEFKEGNLSNDSLKKLPVFLQGFPLFVDTLKLQKELKEYVPYFEKLLQENPNEKVERVYKAFFKGDHANFFVLNHGDFHHGNLMISEKEDGSLNDVALLDYQVCFFGPAIVDLNNLSYVMLDNETRMNKKEELIYFYFQNFVETLEKIGYKSELPKLTDLYKDFLTFKDLELFLVTTYLPFLCKMEEGPLSGNAEEAIHGDYRKSLYENPYFIQTLKKVLPSLLHKGFLE